MDKGTRRLVVGGVVAGALMFGGAALVVGAGIAKAQPCDSTLAEAFGGGCKGDHDKYAYWNQLNQLDPTVTVDTAQNMATTVCRMLDGGASEGKVINSMVTLGIDAGDARSAVYGAQYHFCPQYY